MTSSVPLRKVTLPEIILSFLTIPFFPAPSLPLKTFVSFSAAQWSDFLLARWDAADS